LILKVVSFEIQLQNKWQNATEVCYGLVLSTFFVLTVFLCFLFFVGENFKFYFQADLYCEKEKT